MQANRVTTRLVTTITPDVNLERAWSVMQRLTGLVLSAPVSKSRRPHRCPTVFTATMKCQHSSAGMRTPCTTRSAPGRG
jgi:hypothetical protein